jgi:hypothetical protein
MDSSGVVGVVACFGAVLALVIGLAVWSARRERARVDGLRQWAAARGWTLAQRPDVDWGQRLPGHNRRGVTLALSGVLSGRPVTIAEYFYTRTTYNTTANAASTSTTRTYQYVLLVVRLERPGPTMAVVERGALSRFGRVLFGDTASAVGQEDFDRAYRIVTKDPMAMLGPALLREHVEGRLPEWSLYGDELLTYRGGRIGNPESIPDQLGPLLRVAELLDRPR